MRKKIKKSYKMAQHNNIVQNIVKRCLLSSSFSKVHNIIGDIV